MKITISVIRHSAFMLFLLGVFFPMIAGFLQACRTTPAERQEIRQETRIEERTKDRMERRRD